MNTFEISLPNDPHTHLRSPAQVGEKAFRFLVIEQCKYYGFVVVEPNAFLVEKSNQIETADDLDKYRSLVHEIFRDEDIACIPLFLIKITPKTNRCMLVDAEAAGAIGFKMYPDGVTTGADHGGVSDFLSPQIMDCVAFLEEEDLVFQIHSEYPHRFCLFREFDFHKIIEEYARRFPKLRIFIEHITDRRTVELVLRLRATGARVYGTITTHHLFNTLDDVLGNVYNHCWPCAKFPADRDMLRSTALTGNEAFMSITDSAPWDKEHKHDAIPACAGVFNPARINIPIVYDFFKSEGRLDKHSDFVTGNSCRAYNVPVSSRRLIISDEISTVVSRYNVTGFEIRPFWAEKKLNHRVVAVK